MNLYIALSALALPSLSNRKRPAIQIDSISSDKFQPHRYGELSGSLPTHFRVHPPLDSEQSNRSEPKIALLCVCLLLLPLSEIELLITLKATLLKNFNSIVTVNAARQQPIPSKKLQTPQISRSVKLEWNYINHH